jgi:hypothetical protein
MRLAPRLRRCAGFCAVALLAAGCATLPPGAGYPRYPSAALHVPEMTALGRAFDAPARAHPGRSGFRLLPAGADGFVVRAEMIDAAQRTLDLEYFIFRQDATGWSSCHDAPARPSATLRPRAAVQSRSLSVRPTPMVVCRQL